MIGPLRCSEAAAGDHGDAGDGSHRGFFDGVAMPAPDLQRGWWMDGQVRGRQAFAGTEAGAINGQHVILYKIAGSKPLEASIGVEGSSVPGHGVSGGILAAGIATALFWILVASVRETTAADTFAEAG